jgi:hypothetical protein
MRLSDIILNEAYIDKLASQFSKANPHLDFYVKFGERIDVKGSQQDLINFGTKHDGKKFGEYLDYEVFSIDDDERGEIVRIVKIK